jgi:hypothetical protein
MLHALKGCEKAGIAALPVHDSKIVQARQESKAAEIMEESFARVFKGSKPCIVRVTGKSVSQMPSGPSLSASPSGSLSLERAALAGDFGQALVALSGVAEERPRKSALSKQPVQLNFLSGLGVEPADPEQAIAEAVAAAEAYEGGIIPEPIARVFRDLRQITGERHEDVAREIGTSRSHVVNWERGRFGLGKEPARRLRMWIKERAQAA